MAARKTTRRKDTKGITVVIEKQLRDLSKEVERRVRHLRSLLDRAERQAGTEAAKLLRQARSRLNQVEVKGDSELQRFLRQRRRQISKGLSRAELTVRPRRKAARRTPRRAR